MLCSFLLLSNTSLYEYTAFYVSVHQLMDIWIVFPLELYHMFSKYIYREFPGIPVVRTRCFHCWGPGSIPGGGTKIPQAIYIYIYIYTLKKHQYFPVCIHNPKYDNSFKYVNAAKHILYLSNRYPHILRKVSAV